jgi:ATP-dependent DNA ligase
MKKVKTLYQKAKTGKILYWKAWTDGDEVIIEHGEPKGKAIVNKYTAEATNVGRANERNPEQQAEFEVNSLYLKKLDKKYCKTIKEAKEGKFLPMTAQSGEVISKRNKIAYKAYLQRKYNGLRCMANWRDDNIFLMSRGNKQYKVDHIEEQLERLLNFNDAFDGELYKHGMPLQQINSLVKKWRPVESEVINYVVYDYPYIKGKSLPQKERIDALQKLSTKFRGTNIIIADIWTIKNWEAARALEKVFVEDGYEGAIVRTFDGAYEFGNRSDSLIKVKSFFDGEFEVVGYDVEKSNINSKKIDAVVWICNNDMESPDGTIKTFEVRPTGTLETRAEQLENVQDYIGKLLTVKYYDRTVDKKPSHASGLHFRLEEDLPNES